MPLRAFSTSVLGMAVAFTCSFVPACTADPPLDVAPTVDLSRFQGKWYEIAKLPRATQADCHGTTAFYTQNADGTLSLVNQCNVGSADGPLKTVTMTATVPDPASPAKLALQVGGHTGDYWILDVGPRYEYAVIGHPSREYLWILSRTPTLDATTVANVVVRAAGERFDTSKLEYTPQPPPGDRVAMRTPEGPVPPAIAQSCAMAKGTSASGRARGMAFAISALALGALGRRRRRPSTAGA